MDGAKRTAAEHDGAGEMHRRQSKSPLPAQMRSGRIAPLVQALASLLWLPQAALLAQGGGAIAAGNTAAIPPIAAAVIALGVVRALLDAAGTRLAFRFARAVLSGRRAQAVAALAERSPLDSGKPASGLAASVLAEQAEAIVPYLSRYRPARLKAVLVPAGILLCVFPLSWAAALVLLVSAPLIPLFMALIGWRAKAASERHLAGMGDMNGFLLDRLRGLATIRALGAVDFTAQRLRANAEALRMRTMAVLRIAFLSSAVLELFAALGVAMVAVYIGFHFLGQLEFGAWGRRLDLGEGLFILLLAPAFFEPLRDVSSVWHDRAAGEAAMEALEALAATGVAMPGGSDGKAGPAHGAACGLRLRGLEFRHAGSAAPLFAGFDLDVAPGEHIALLGPSGCGKSSLLALIAGLAAPQGGSIEIDGRGLDASSADGLRRRMAWMGQKPHIFAGTLSANIALGRQHLGRAQIGAALAAAALGPVADARGDGQVGEGGTGFSGGEMRRLALARAAADASAGLILADEPTAHLDAASARAIADNLLAIAAGRTLIVATHDPVLARRMDRIVALPLDRRAEDAS